MTIAATPGMAVPRDLFDDYRDRRHAGAYDEAIDENGELRPHWRRLARSLAGLSAAEIAARATRLDRRVRETGIAYDIFADPSAPAQRWQLDLMPIVISAGEWRWLEKALTQRARLFDALLSDLYGAQRTLREGIVPAELVFSDASFLRPCQDVLPRAGGLRFYAADLARDAAGRWRVIDNHTETLAGIGFALANRVAHTHVAGDLFKQTNAIRLASFFQRLQSGLTAQSGRSNARIALLTPGPHHADYFSHAYLARYLGYLLVEGNDLRTKDGRVHLKTLEGLKEIDLIIRCVEGRLTDPLELDPAGFLGPPGLMRACRAAPRLIANALGTALAQNRGLGSFLPAAAEALLDEPLQLNDAPRDWLGDAATRQRLLEAPAGVAIRPAQEGTGRPGQAAVGRDLETLTDDERADLAKDLALHGASLVAERHVGFSCAPSLGTDGLTGAPFAIRLFVARTDDGYEAMPGGLAMTVDPGKAVALSSPDGRTRDIWVLSDAEQRPHVSLWRPAVETARVERSQRVIQSRVADDLFWLGRYAERADWTMRVLRGALRRIEDDGGSAAGRHAARLSLMMMLREAPRDTLPAAEIASADLEALCTKVISTGKTYRTLTETLAGLYRVASLTRDRLSLEAWQVLARFRPHDGLPATLASAPLLAMLDLIDDGLASIAAFNGLAHENMTRNFGWSFLDMGRRLERAYNLSEAILTLFVPRPSGEAETDRLFLLLELADSFITYRSRYRLDPMLPLALDLLLLDEANPRSLAFQLTAISNHLSSLPESRQGVSLTEDRRLILALQTAIRLADVQAIADAPDDAVLQRLMLQQLDGLPELSNAVASHYFSLTDDAPHRVHARIEPRS